jgi:shikimate dehydrogenase
VIDRGAIRLALIGDPVDHSLSPSIQSAFLRERGIDGTYDAFRVPAGQGMNAIMKLRSAGYLGLNVTTPLKEEAFAACDLLDDVAREAGAVNTLVLTKEKVIGGNTDGNGAVHAIESVIGSVDSAWVLVLGAGATARAAVRALSRAGAHVMVWNRTAARAQSLADHHGIRVWDSTLRADAALSTLPPGVEPEGDLLRALVTCPIIVDANYGARATLGTKLDRPVIDGTAMLQGSARESFEIWMEALR